MTARKNPGVGGAGEAVGAAPEAPTAFAHTPTPWKVKRVGVISDREGDVIATLGFMVQAGEHDPDEANTRFIVLAVNAHSALVEALEDLARYADGAPEELQDKAFAALSLARGES